MVTITLSPTANVPEEELRDAPALNNSKDSDEGVKDTPKQKLVDDNSSNSSSEVEDQAPPKLFEVFLDRPRPDGVRIAR